MTESEFKKRYSRERTDKMAMLCLFCGNIDEVQTRFSDGCVCSSCGRMVRPIGFLKKQKQGRHKNRIRNTKRQSKKHFSNGLCLFVGASPK